MEWGGPNFVLAIIAISTVGWIATSWIRARHGYPVLRDGQSVGVITSGTWSPTLGEAIALAYVPSDAAKLGTELAVEIRGKAAPATVKATTAACR